ncbi:hypothetical protein [Micromonospora sp. NPDC047074]|uniref:hypothetical protein n=1 Tax=Micromonospora sp. NPDC047074 TaxID=3154339 RepID=UPI0033F45A28
MAGTAALISVVAISPTPAQAVTTWTLSNTPADVTGAWVHGTWWWGASGRLYVEVNVKDTVANSKNASVSLAAGYSDGGVRREDFFNNDGANTTVTMTYSFAPNVSFINARECVDNASGLATCGNTVRIFG